MKAFYFLLCIFAVSCVSRKQTVLFQDKLEQAVSVDSSGNSFSVQSYSYLLRPNDIINVRVGSLTEPNFDFISQYEAQMGEYLTISPNTAKNGSNTTVGQSLLGSSSVIVSSAQQQGLFATPLKPNIYVEQQSHGYKVNQTGNVVLPVVGEVPAAGLTLDALDSVLQQKFTGFFEKVQVRCQLINFHFTVMGEVKNQGRYTNFNPEATVLEAVNMAGNFTEFANRSRIKIIRTQNNKKQVLYCNFLKEDAIVSPAFQLYPDDIIIVPELKVKAFRSYTMKDMQFSLSLVSGLLSIVAVYIALSKK